MPNPQNWPNPPARGQQEGDQPRRIFTPLLHSLPAAPSAAAFAAYRSRLRDRSSRVPFWHNALWQPHLRPGAPHQIQHVTRSRCWQARMGQFSNRTCIKARIPATGQPLEISADHSVVVDKLLGELEVRFASQEFWIVLVPSSSEQLGHHRAWDPNRDPSSDRHWVEPEYRARLRAAYLLLVTGIARYVFISGGEVDTEHCYDDPTDGNHPYIDALFGRQELIERYQDHWSGVSADGTPNVRDEFRRERLTSDPNVGALDPLENRILVDPYALHSETNVRNCDRFCASVGLDRNLIATTFGMPLNDIGGRHANFGQGDWFAGFWPADVASVVWAPSTFRFTFVRSVGYEPGSLKQLAPYDNAGIFGKGLNFDHPALAWIPFVAGLQGNEPRRGELDDWRTGIIFHDKFQPSNLLADQNIDDPDKPDR